jgi:hypothetical protein
MSEIWNYLEVHNNKLDTKVKGHNVWPMFKNKNTGITSFQYIGELPPGVYREFDTNGDPIYKNASGKIVHLTGENYKKPLTYLGQYPLPNDWKYETSNSHNGFFNYYKKGDPKGKYAAPGVLPEGLKLKFNDKNVIFYQGPKPLNKVYYDSDLKGPLGWRHPVFTAAGGSTVASLVPGVNPLPSLAAPVATAAATSAPVATAPVATAAAPSPTIPTPHTIEQIDAWINSLCKCKGTQYKIKPDSETLDNEFFKLGEDYISDDGSATDLLK